jgi:hypothetical protein
MSQVAITYSPRTFALAALSAVIGGVALLVTGLLTGTGIFMVIGVVALVFGLGFGYGTRDRIRGGVVALDREGDFLVGAAVKRPLPIAGTTFETVKGYESGWLVVLYSNGQRYQLAPGGWRVVGERRFTRAVAERALLALGLTPHP